MNGGRGLTTDRRNKILDKGGRNNRKDKEQDEKLQGRNWTTEKSLNSRSEKHSYWSIAMQEYTEDRPLK